MCGTASFATPLHVCTRVYTRADVPALLSVEVMLEGVHVVLILCFQTRNASLLQMFAVLRL